MQKSMEILWTRKENKQGSIKVLIKRNNEKYKNVAVKIFWSYEKAYYDIENHT